MDEQFVSIGKAAKMLGMSIDGLRKGEREGHLIPVRTVTNHRRYRVADLRAPMHEDAPDVARDTRGLLDARVSTKKQQDAGNLDRQLGRLTAFAAEQRWTVVAALTDVASGLNEKRGGSISCWILLSNPKRASWLWSTRALRVYLTGKLPARLWRACGRHGAHGERRSTGTRGGFDCHDHVVLGPH